MVQHLLYSVKVFKFDKEFDGENFELDLEKFHGEVKKKNETDV